MVEEICLNIKRGDSWSRTLYFQDGDGNPLDITGWEIRFTIKAKIDDLDNAAIIHQIITTFTNPIAGEAGISLSATETAQAIGSYLFDIQAKTNLGQVTTVLEGVINISQDVTRLS